MAAGPASALPVPRLALDCVGGAAGSSVARMLGRVAVSGAWNGWVARGTDGRGSARAVRPCPRPPNRRALPRRPHHPNRPRFPPVVHRPGGVHVTYGGLGRAPLAVPASALIFKNISLRGFWLSGPHRGASRAARAAVIDEAAALFASGKLVPGPAAQVPLAEWRDALAALRAGGSGAAKQLLVPP